MSAKCQHLSGFYRVYVPSKAHYRLTCLDCEAVVYVTDQESTLHGLSNAARMELQKIKAEVKTRPATGLKTWYLLFSGSSPDGRGDASFLGRTVELYHAIKHLKSVKADPHSTGYVLIVTDTSYTRATSLSPTGELQ